MNSENQSLLFGIVIILGLLGSCACLLSTFLQMNRAHKWYSLHMPLLPDSSNLRLDAALRDAEEGFNVCMACGFENLKRNIFCTICGSPIECLDSEEGKKRKKTKTKDKLHHERQRVSANLNRRRQTRALKRKEWVRKVDVEGNLYWYRDTSLGTETQFPGYVLQFFGDPPVEPAKVSTEPASSAQQPEQEPTEPLPPPPTAIHGGDDNEDQEVVITVETGGQHQQATASAPRGSIPRRSRAHTDEQRPSIIVEEAEDTTTPPPAEAEMTTEDETREAKKIELELLTLEQTSDALHDEITTRPMTLVESIFANPARPAINDTTDSYLREDPKAILSNAQLDFPTKIAEFVTRTSTVLVSPGEQSFLKLKIRRSNLLGDSIETLAATPTKFSRCAIRLTFVGEQGVDAGGVYREWLVIINEQIVAPSTGIYKCVNTKDHTFHLNAMSKYDIGDNHLAHFFAAGRLLGRALLEGNVTGFHLSLPLLKVILGQPVAFADLEYFDPDAYKSLLWLLDNDGVDHLGLDFTVTEQTLKGEIHTIELIPGGRNIDVNDQNKFEYADRKLKYLLFESISSQLFAYLKGVYEVMPPEMLLMFDAEELDYIISGSDEIDVDDWERNSKYTADLIEHFVREWFWDLVREMPNEYRRRLLLFTTGSSRVPLAGFMALTSYDGRLCPFTLKGVDFDVDQEGGYIRSHACFNRLDIPRYTSKAQLKTVLYAVLDTEQYGFTTD